MLSQTLLDNPELMAGLRELMSIPNIAGLVVWIVLFVWQTKGVKKGKLYNRGLKKIEAATKAGRVVQAQYVTGWSTNDNRRYHRTYTYEVDGIQYKKTFSTNHIRMERELTLYYTRSPKGAKTYSQMRGVLPDVMPLLSSLLLGAAVLLVLQHLGF